ncbi:Uncharacterised protein [Budvicia aquatica]|uniref:Uncharacterized protein n=1 Tax=Budvicia aquatica TaxID=82979 RepID=A0A484ZRS6_9GAMM|nr:Uncharacterised protein [Budvicia aquatica]
MLAEFITSGVNYSARHPRENGEPGFHSQANSRLKDWTPFSTGDYSRHPHENGAPGFYSQANSRLKGWTPFFNLSLIHKSPTYSLGIFLNFFSVC